MTLFRPKLSVTISMTLDESIALRDLLRPYVQPSRTENLSNERQYLRTLFTKLYGDLRDDLPPVNHLMQDLPAFYGSVGE